MYGANTVAAIKVLEGDFEPPSITSTGTILVFKEIAQIYKKIEGGEQQW